MELKILDKPPSRFFVFFFYTILAIGLLISIIIGFHHLLDDTFIHLRYGKNLLATGKLFYNYNQESFGTSSLAYLFYISSFLNFFAEKDWPLIIKLSSIVVHIFSILILLKISFNKKMDKIKLYKFILFIVIIFFLLAVPSVTRWLTDGMETSVGVLTAFLSVYIITKIGSIRNNFLYNLFISVVVVLPGILRIDLLPIVAANVILLFLIDKDVFKRRQIIFIIVPLLISLWLLVTVIFTHAIVPDSAIAKQVGKFDLLWYYYFIKSMISTSPVWLAALFIAIMLIIVKKNIERVDQIILLVGLIPILSQLLAGSIFGQAIHGARYFLPSIAYLCALILFIINKNNFFEHLPKFQWKLSAFLATIIIVSVIHTIVFWSPINRVIQRTYLSIPHVLNDPNLMIGIADVGQIGWYTNSRIFDLNALINGRNIAKTIPNKRLEKLIMNMGFPDYLILKQEDLQEYKINEDKISLMGGGQSHTYIKTNHLIMQMHNINRSLDWILWNKLK